MTSLSDFKHSLFLVVWVTNCSFQKSRPQRIILPWATWKSAYCSAECLGGSLSGDQSGTWGKFFKMAGQPQTLWLEAPPHKRSLSAPGESVTCLKDLFQTTAILSSSCWPLASIRTHDTQNLTESDGGRQPGWGVLSCSLGKENFLLVEFNDPSVHKKAGLGVLVFSLLCEWV